MKLLFPRVEIPEVSDAVVRVCVLASLVASGLTSLFSAAVHLAMDVYYVVPLVETMQFLVELCLWGYAVRTKKWRVVLPLQMTGAFLGMSTVVLIGGSNFLTNCFWIALISPFALITGHRVLAVVFFVSELILIWLYFELHGPQSNSPEAIFAVDAALFTFAMPFMALIIKNWQNNISAEIEDARNRNSDLVNQKLQHLVHLNHELRNPIAAIMASIDLLSKNHSEAIRSSSTPVELERDNQNRYLVNTIRSTSHHVVELLNDVLEMERLESGAIKDVAQTFSVRALVREVIDIDTSIAKEAGNTIKTRVAVELHDQWVGPKSRIRQVLLNLTSNACKHAPNSEIVISVFEQDRALVFQVADTGPGMSAHAMEHLYQPYASSMGSTGNSGLGLRISQLIIEKHMGGSIDVKSSPGSGTTFTIRLPLSKDCSQQQWEYVESSFNPQNVANPVDMANFQALVGKRILLVEDDKTNLELMTMVMERIGLIVKSAMTAQAAMAIVSKGDAIDIALIDHNLGAGSTSDGVQLASELVAAGVGTVVGHTGNCTPEVEAKWREAGVSCIIRKPVSTSDLIATLARQQCQSAN